MPNRRNAWTDDAQVDNRIEILAWINHAGTAYDAQTSASSTRQDAAR